MAALYFVFQSKTTNNLSRRSISSVEEVLHLGHQLLPGNLYRAQPISGLIGVDLRHLLKSGRRFKKRWVQRPLNEFNDSHVILGSCLFLCSIRQSELAF